MGKKLPPIDRQPCGEAPRVPLNEKIKILNIQAKQPVTDGAPHQKERPFTLHQASERLQQLLQPVLDPCT